jgi:NitT/TauT family transport system ATP-binding protein
VLRLVGGLLEPDAGTVLVHDASPAAARRAKQFALVPQVPALLPWRTVRDNARLLTQVGRGRADHPTLDPEAIDALLDEVGLGAFLDAFPRELSGGMQQRVALERAFALAAPVLLLDEPFAALDEITRGEMRYLLTQLWHRTGATALFVTHSIAEAIVLSDRVAVMAPRPGRIATIEEVPLARPRTPDIEDTPAFHALEARLRHALYEAMAA